MISPPPPSVTFDRSEDLHALARGRADRVSFVIIPERTYFAIDGTEPPGGDVYMAAIQTLYPVAYGLHFALRRRGVSARVGMLEGLYWLTPELSHWRLLIAVPAEASELEIESAIRDASRRRPLPLLDRLHTLRWEEGHAAQIVHVGPYAAETRTIRRLHDAIHQAGFEPCGQHHEIYLNNPQQVGEAKARTLLRQPVSPVEDAPGLD